MLNLDTHVLLHAVAGTLTPAERVLLSGARWSISAIVLWKIAKLAQIGRIAVDLEDSEVVRVLGQVHVWPLTREVAHVTTQLDVKGDPADQIIAATSVVYQVPLVTRDKVIRRSKRVPFPSRETPPVSTSLAAPARRHRVSGSASASMPRAASRGPRDRRAGARPSAGAGP